MTNRAAQELAAIRRATDGGQAAQDADAVLNRLEPDPAVRPVKDRDKAGFAIPEALATAIAGGFILGPVGGLVLGAAQGLFTQRERQNALDEHADKQGVLTDTRDVFQGQIDALKQSATNPEDLEQIAALEARLTASYGLMANASPDMQAIGANEFTKFTSDLQAYTNNQEAQRIAREAEDARLRVELDNEQYARYTSSQSDFTAESQTYLDIRQATDTALAALDRGTPADLWAASILVNKALDPTGVVRSEEAQAVGELGSAWDKAATILQRLKSGESILPEQRQELADLLGTIQQTATRFQLAREARYSDEIVDIGLPDKYHDNFRLVEQTPAAVQTNIQQGEPGAVVLNDIRDGIVGTADEPGMFEKVWQDTVDAVSRGMDATAEWYKRTPEERMRRMQENRRPTN